MDNTLQNYKGSTFMAELSGWNQQEQKFRSLFSDQALQDRDFLKMKLAEYNRIWYKYNGTVQSTDEKALMIMLRFHRRKLQKTIFPGLITRLLSRAYAFTKGMVSQWIAGQSVRKAEGYNLNPIPVPQQVINVEKPEAQARDNIPHQRQNQHQQHAQGNKPRTKKNHHRHKHKGRSL
jgi:hypothetical protein